MLKILLVALLVGLVSSCAMEDPDTSGVLVDPNSETEVPDWVTASSLDLNRDGIVDILDLVIHSKFMGQEVVDESPDTTSDGYKLPDLPNPIYLMAELDQLGRFDRAAREYVIDSDYPQKIKVAMRLQQQKRDRNEVLTDLNTYNVMRFSEFDDLDVYVVTEATIKIISNQETAKTLPQINNMDEISGNSRRGPQTYNRTYLGDRIKCSTGDDYQALDATRTDSTVINDASSIRLITAYSYRITNISEIQENSCSCIPSYRWSHCASYYAMKDGIHIGENLSGNLGTEKYTNAYIYHLEYKVKPEGDKHIKYSFADSWNGHKDPLPRGRSFNDMSQQEIKEEHFPEDIDE